MKFDFKRLVSGLRARLSFFKEYFTREPAKDPALFQAQQDDRDSWDWYTRLTRLLEHKATALPVFVSPLVQPPPNATIIDYSTVLAIETTDFDNRYLRPWATLADNYRVPRDHLAVIRFWGMTAYYDSASWDVGGPYALLKMTLCGSGGPDHDDTDMADSRPPYAGLYRPGTAESICYNAMLILQGGEYCVPVVQALTASPSAGCNLHVRVFGWHIPKPGYNKEA